MKECPTLICSHYWQRGAVDSVQHLFNQPNLLVPSVSPYNPWLCCYRHKHHQFSEFEIVQQLCSPPLMCSIYSQPGIWNPVLDLFDVWNLVVPSILPSAQWLWWCKYKHIQFSEFDILQQLCSPPLMCSIYSQPGIWNPVLDLFDVWNLVAPSILPSAQWLLWCKYKHIQFSEFDIPQQLNSLGLMCSVYSQPGIWNAVLYLIDALNLLMPSVLRSDYWLWCCKHKHLQFSHFQNPTPETTTHTTTRDWQPDMATQPGLSTRMTNQDQAGRHGWLPPQHANAAAMGASRPNQQLARRIYSQDRLLSSTQKCGGTWRLIFFFAWELDGWFSAVWLGTEARPHA